jgi:hypothetical protein
LETFWNRWHCEDHTPRRSRSRKYVDLETRTLVAVRGKGDSIHDLPLNAETVTLLEQWLENRPAVAEPVEPALLVGSRGARLSIRAVERLIAGLRASVTKKHLTPHTLRHTAASLALVLGCDVATVGDLLRHASLDTTRHYLHLVDQRKRDAVARLGSTIPRSVLPLPTAGNQLAKSAPEPTPQNARAGKTLLDDQYPLADVEPHRPIGRDEQSRTRAGDPRRARWGQSVTRPSPGSGAMAGRQLRGGPLFDIWGG